MIDKLSKNSAAGYDGITAEYLLYGKSHALCAKLAHLFSLALSWNIVPSTFTIAVIVPVLKKSNSKFKPPR